MMRQHVNYTKGTLRSSVNTIYRGAAEKKKPACCGLRFNVLPMLLSLFQPMLSAWCETPGRPGYLPGAAGV